MPTYTRQVKVPFINNYKRLAAHTVLGPYAKEYIDIPLINTPGLAKEFATDKFMETNYFDSEWIDKITDLEFSSAENCYIMTLHIGY